MSLKRRRKATVIRVGNSSGLTLTDEFETVGIKNGDDVMISVINDKIEIKKFEEKK